jgi:mannose-1-phosphate guanylyltransferase
LPADHLIADYSAFSDAVHAATILAEEGSLVTFGIQPTAPETGFGYIEAGANRGPGRTALRFVEKPDAATAADYLANGNFFWNSGMFCFRAGDFLETMLATCPDVLQAARDCWTSTQAHTPEVAGMVDLDAASFAAQPDISIDYAVMEKASNVSIIPCTMGWSDIGSWSALGDLVAPDEAGNRTLGDAVLVGTKNTFIQSEHNLVAAVGVEDLIIVATQDALLVAHKDKSQDVRLVVQQLKRHGHEAYRLHRTVSRPWGTFTVLEEGKRFKIKRIEVKPGASLSLQMHHHRSEHWIVVSGMARVVNGESETYVSTNESTYIPAGHKHRLENPGILDLVMIEVQSGEYLGEDDIVRFEDIYGRAPAP